MNGILDDSDEIKALKAEILSEKQAKERLKRKIEQVESLIRKHKCFNYEGFSERKRLKFEKSDCPERTPSRG